MTEKWLHEAEHLYSAVVLDALDGLGYRRQSPSLQLPGMTVRRPLVGVAKCLLWVDFAYDDPNTYDLELKAVDSIKDGEVVVCATGSSSRSGIWGELLTTAAMSHGARGVVTDGTIRDITRMTEMDFPVYAAGACALDSYSRQKVVDYDVSIELGGVSVKPGDIIVADADGVAIVPREVEADVLSAALEKINNENEFRRAVKGGMPLVDA